MKKHKETFRGGVTIMPFKLRMALREIFTPDELSTLVTSIVAYLDHQNTRGYAGDVTSGVHCLTKLIYVLDEEPRKQFLAVLKTYGIILDFGTEVDLTDKTEAEIKEIERAYSKPDGSLH